MHMMIVKKYFFFYFSYLSLAWLSKKKESFSKFNLIFQDFLMVQSLN